MKLGEFIDSLQHTISWSCIECKKHGTIQYSSNESPDEIVQKIKSDHHTKTFDFKHKEETCENPEFEVFTSAQLTAIDEEQDRVDN